MVWIPDIIYIPRFIQNIFIDPEGEFERKAKEIEVATRLLKKEKKEDTKPERIVQ